MGENDVTLCVLRILQSIYMIIFSIEFHCWYWPTLKFFLFSVFFSFFFSLFVFILPYTTCTFWSMLLLFFGTCATASRIIFCCDCDGRQKMMAKACEWYLFEYFLFFSWYFLKYSRVFCRRNNNNFFIYFIQTFYFSFSFCSFRVFVLQIPFSLFSLCVHLCLCAFAMNAKALK